MHGDTRAGRNAPVVRTVEPQRFRHRAGEVGARVRDIESRQGRLEDQNVGTKSLLSSLADTDFTEAVARFQTLQNSLQATLQTTGQILNLSLLDFIG